MNHIVPGLQFIFTSPYEQYAERRGQKAVVIDEVNPYSFDYDEVGAMYTIRFEDGTEISAWPEEIPPESGIKG